MSKGKMIVEVYKEGDWEPVESLLELSIGTTFRLKNPFTNEYHIDHYGYSEWQAVDDPYIDPYFSQPTVSTIPIGENNND